MPPDFFASFTHPDNFGTFIGYETVAFDRTAREARLKLTVQEKHLSPAGKMHGGVISAFLDYSCGVATCTTLEEGDLCSTVELKVNYFRPVHLGDELEAVAKVVFRGKKLCALTAFLHKKGEADPAAMATATFNVVLKSQP
jgi:acyl-CoA thioesterase